MYLCIHVDNAVGKMCTMNMFRCEGHWDLYTVTIYQSQRYILTVYIFPYKSHIFRVSVRTVIVSKKKWSVFVAWWWNIQKCRQVKNGECGEVKRSEVRWNEVMILGEMCIWLFIYTYVTVRKFCVVCYTYVTARKFCVVCYLIIICFSMLFSNYIDLHFLIFFVCLFFVFYYVYSLFLYCFVYCFSFCAVSFLFLCKSTDHCHLVETKLR
jgi:hypothetical protein